MGKTTYRTDQHLITARFFNWAVAAVASYKNPQAALSARAFLSREMLRNFKMICERGSANKSKLGSDKALLPIWLAQVICRDFMGQTRDPGPFLEALPRTRFFIFLSDFFGVVILTLKELPQPLFRQLEIDALAKKPSDVPRRFLIVRRIGSITAG